LDDYPTWSTAAGRVAARIADLLADDGLVAHPRTSGGKGLQLYLPVTVGRDGRTSEFARSVAEELARDDPARVTAVMARARRRGKGLVGWSPEQPGEDDHRELLAAGPGPAHGGHPGDVGRGAGLPASRGPGVHRRRPAGAHRRPR